MSHQPLIPNEPQEPKVASPENIYSRLLEVAVLAVKGLKRILGTDIFFGEEEAIARLLMKQGGTSVPVSALLLVNMLDGYRPAGDEYLEILFAHHILEVISDELPTQLANIFNALALDILNGNLNNVEDIRADQRFTKLAGALKNVPPIQMGSMEMPIIDALLANLMAVAKLKDLTQDWPEHLKDFAIQALKNRYNCSTNINHHQYNDGSVDDATKDRCGAILIEVTMIYVSYARSKQEGNSDLADALKIENFDKLKKLFSSVSTVVGLLNDVGTKLLMNEPANAEFRGIFIAWLKGKHDVVLNNLELSQENPTNLRELFALIGFEKKDKKLDTEELVQQAAEIDNSIDWKFLMQILKDLATGEPNLFLDRKMKDGEDLISFIESLLNRLSDIAAHHIAIIQDIALLLGKNASISAVVALIMHLLLYAAGDYYDKSKNVDFFTQMQDRFTPTVENFYAHPARHKNES